MRLRATAAPATGRRRGAVLLQLVAAAPPGAGAPRRVRPEGLRLAAEVTLHHTLFPLPVVQPSGARPHASTLTVTTLRPSPVAASTPVLLYASMFLIPALRGTS